MKNNATLFAVIALALSIFALVNASGGPSTSSTETTAERVLRTGTLRCGYFLWAPILSKDMNTGAFSGISFDIMTELAARLELKIEWTEEPPLEMALKGLNSNRYDAFCAPLYANSNRSREAAFSSPIAYIPVYVVVRANDKRFSGDGQIMNDAKYRMAIMDGEITAILGEKMFAKTTKNLVSQTQGYSMMFKDVEAGKADFTISELQTIKDYNKTNNNALKIIGAPVITNAVAYPLPHDMRLKGMFDTTLNEMMMDGAIAKIFKKYSVEDTYKLPIQPFAD